MPFIPAPNHLQSRLQFVWGGQRVYFLLNFKYTSAPGATERTALNTAMHTFWTNHLKTHCSQDIGLSQIDAVDLTSSSSPSSTLVISPLELGTVGTKSVKLNTALVVTHRTDLRGRNFRGRTYIPGLPDDAGDSNGGPAAARIADLLGDFAWLLNAVNTAAGIWSVISRFTGNAPRAVATSTPITAVSADSFFDSQRRRLVGRGS